MIGSMVAGDTVLDSGGSGCGTSVSAVSDVTAGIY